MLARDKSEGDNSRQRERMYNRTKDSRSRSQNREHKKKKKHRDQRHSRSRDSRKQKKHKKHHDRERSRSHDEERRKHKKHKQHKEHKRDRSRSERRQKKHKSHRSSSRDRNQRNLKQEKKQTIQTPREEAKYFKDRNNVDLQSKDPYFEDRRQIQRVRRQNPQKAQRMQEQLEKKIIFDAKRRQYEQMKEKFREAQKQMQEAKRQDHTILVYCLPLKAKQKDIWNFFSKAGCGRIRDIRIIRDQRSGKSKGVAYVEFYTSQSVQKALTMKERPIEVKGRQFTGLKIQHSQAQKNRAAAAAKQMKVTKQVDPYEQERQSLKRQTKVQIRGLVGSLAKIAENDLKDIFEPFGDIDYVDINRDPDTGQCRGFAFIQFARIQDAKKAVRNLDGIKIKGHAIQVSTVSHIQRGQVSKSDEFLHSEGSKMALMNQLSRGGQQISNIARPPMSTVPYQYIVMSNSFQMKGTSPEFFEKLKKEILERCAEFGIVEKIFIEKNNQGNVWIKFSDTVTATKAHGKLSNEYIDNRKIFCYFVTEDTWKNRVGL